MANFFLFKFTGCLVSVPTELVGVARAHGDQIRDQIPFCMVDALICVTKNTRPAGAFNLLNKIISLFLTKTQEARLETILGWNLQILIQIDETFS